MHFECLAYKIQWPLSAKLQMLSLVIATIMFALWLRPKIKFKKPGDGLELKNTFNLPFSL